MSPNNPNERSNSNSNSNILSVEMVSEPVALVARGDDQRWWRKVVNVEEAKKQIVLALPMVLTNASYFLVPLVSVMFAGHLGPLQLAGATLALSWASVSGVAFMVGLSGALETLCGQAFGAERYKVMGIYLQASCIISLLFSIIISILWWYTEPILKLFHQSPDISREAATFIRNLITGLFAYGTVQNILRFLQTQSVVLPLVICSFVPLFLHIGLAYVLVHFTTLGYSGAPLATSFTFWVSLIMLMVYVSYAKKFEQTWTGLSKESFHYVITNSKLALPSSAMVCLEYWSFEILVLLAGLMPNPKTSTSLLAMCLNTSSIAYNITYGLSAAASTRVSNELGAMRPKLAKNAMTVSLKLSILLTSVILLTLGFGRNVWASSFSDSTDIIKAFSSMTPLLCLSLLIDSVQGILSGVSRGCGWQQQVMFINLGTFYGIGMPIGVLLAFKLKLHTKGLWIGVICGLGCQSSALFLLACFKKWTALDISANRTENPGSV